MATSVEGGGVRLRPGPRADRPLSRMAVPLESPRKSHTASETPLLLLRSGGKALCSYRTANPPGSVSWN